MTISTNEQITFDRWCYLRYGRHTKPISKAEHIDKYYELMENYESWCRASGKVPQSRPAALAPLGIIPF